MTGLEQEYRALLIYPPGPVYQRGDDRCQSNVEASAAASTRSCNDLGYAAAVLRDFGYTPTIKDFQTERYRYRRALDEVIAFQADLLMISVTYGSIYDDLLFAKAVRDGYALTGKPNLTIVLKGAVFFNPPEAIMRELDVSSADYLIGGEVDTSIGLIADYALRGKGDPDAIPAILYKPRKDKAIEEREGAHSSSFDSSCSHETAFIRTRFDAWNTELDDIPFPARDLMDLSLYKRPDTGSPMATIQTSRGCYGSCTYCMAPTVSGRRVRFRSPQNVFAEIEECYTLYEVKDFYFKSDTFTANEKWVRELCELIIDSPLAGKIAFSVNARVRPLQKETLQFLKMAGCFLISFSFESGSPETLIKTRKGAKVSDNISAAMWSREVGIPVYGFFTVGFPWEDQSHLKMTQDHIYELKPDYLEIHIALPYWGTKLHELYSQTGALEDRPPGEGSFASNISGKRTLTLGELRRFRRRVQLGYYMRPNYVWNKIAPTLKSPKTTLDYIFYGLRLIRNTLKDS